MSFPAIIAVLGLIGDKLKDKDFIEMRRNFTPNMDLDDLAEKCLPTINKIIEVYQSDEYALTFIAGRFTVKGFSVESFNITYDLNFKDERDEWHQVLRTSDTMSSNRWLSENARRELDKAELNEIHFDIKGANTPY